MWIVLCIVGNPNLITLRLLSILHDERRVIEELSAVGYWHVPLYTKIIIIITSSQILPKYFTVIFTVKVRAYKTGLTPPLFIKVSVPIQESEQSCICVLGESVLPLSTKQVSNLNVNWPQDNYLKNRSFIWNIYGKSEAFEYFCPLSVFHTDDIILLTIKWKTNKKSRKVCSL
jgi:hypothetical protein